jgi:hypothetical protein
MITCKYCGQELQFVGETDQIQYFNCTFCDMIFPLSETSVDRKRKMSVPEYIDDMAIYQSTKDYLKRDTITLYHVLKEIRKHWYSIKTLLEKMKIHYEEGHLPKPKEEDQEVVKNLKKEFIDITKKKFVVENIILERTGFLPEKITEEFLSNIIEQGYIASSKPMFIYIK